MEHPAGDGAGWRRGLAVLGVLVAAALLAGLGYAATSDGLHLVFGGIFVAFVLAVPVVALVVRRRHGVPRGVRPFRRFQMGISAVLAAGYVVAAVLADRPSMRWLNGALALVWSLQLIHQLRLGGRQSTTSS